MEIAFVGFLESDGMPNLEEIGKKTKEEKAIIINKGGCVSL